MGIEYVLQECQELIEEYKKNSHRAGYKDITQEPWPEDEVEGEEDNSPRPKIPRQVRFMDDEEGTGPLGETERGLPPDVVPSPESPIESANEEEEDQAVSHNPSVQTLPEPEAENIQSRRASAAADTQPTRPTQQSASAAAAAPVTPPSEEVIRRFTRDGRSTGRSSSRTDQVQKSRRAHPKPILPQRLT